MSWEICLKEHIQKIEPSKETAESLSKMAELRLKFWSQKFDNKFTPILIEGYYEIIKELLTALLYIEGLKSDNHECLIAYLSNKYPQLKYETEIIYQLKNIRNDLRNI